MSDDGLDDESGERRSQPEDRNLVGAGAQVFVDGAHVGHLESPAKLNAEESEAHVPDLPEGFGGLFHVDRLSDFACTGLVRPCFSP